MSEMFSIGMSALVSNQRLLATAGHNIANANTEGYSRQTVSLAQRDPQYAGVGFVGKGVEVSAITRTASEFLINNVRYSASSQSRAASYADFAGQVDNLLSDGTFSPAMQKFFGSLQDVNNDPASIPARAVLLNSANTLTDRFQDLHTRLSTLSSNVNERLSADVDRLNSLASALSGLNQDIVGAFGASQGQPPNDLLDQRDQLLRQMSELVNLNATSEQDGSVNVYIGHGQLLVAGARTVKLAVTPNALDGSRKEVSIVNSGGSSQISAALSGGTLAGTLQFREQVLEPARNAIGRLAVVLAETFNAQHQAGVDLTGTRGAKVFTYSPPVVTGAATNGGTLTVTIDPTNLANLSTSDYTLTFDGTDYTLERLDNATTQTLTGPGPFSVEGLVITPSATMAAGDIFQIQPTKYAARYLDVAVSDAQRWAVASPVKSTTTLANLGSAKVSAPMVLDANNAALQTPVQLVFNSASTYQVNGVGPSLAYTSGANIDINGWRVQITDSPRTGDTFQVAANPNGQGDNTNGLRLLDLRMTGFMDGGSATYQDAFGRILGQTGSLTQQAQISRDSLKVQLDSSEAAREQVAGVNLDQEAADLIRYQQSYQAAAQVIAAADAAFQALIAAMRG
ncbi:MAG: flagellar hook-associated protein FlgK [Gammaproteobacteria bacterium]|nr:flagellar hook-associated protein FlgK [Gammaproteobacteria bacterium]